MVPVGIRFPGIAVARERIAGALSDLFRSSKDYTVRSKLLSDGSHFSRYARVMLYSLICPKRGV